MSGFFSRRDTVVTLCYIPSDLPKFYFQKSPPVFSDYLLAIWQLKAGNLRKIKH